MTQKNKSITRMILTFAIILVLNNLNTLDFIIGYVEGLRYFMYFILPLAMLILILLSLNEGD